MCAQLAFYFQRVGLRASVIEAPVTACVVRGAWCVVRGAWCVVRGANTRGCVCSIAWGLSDQELEAAGIPGGLVRFSCGLEDTVDVLTDVANALKQAS